MTGNTNGQFQNKPNRGSDTILTRQWPHGVPKRKKKIKSSDLIRDLKMA